MYLSATRTDATFRTFQMPSLARDR